MDTRKMKLALSAGALALSMALAGCGGGGGPASPTQAELDAQAAEKRRMEQTGDIMTAIGAAETAVAAISTANPTQTQVDAANTAIGAAEMAIDDAADVEDKSSYTDRVAELKMPVMLAETAIAQREGRETAEGERDDAEDKLSEAERQARAEMAKALLPVLKMDADARGSNTAASVLIMAQMGPAIHPAGEDFPDGYLVTLKAVKDSEAMLGDWNGMDYSHTASDKATIMARVYNNEADATMKPIGDVYGSANTDAKITSLANGVYTLTVGANSRLKADAFPEEDQGTITYLADTDKRMFNGMFQGAPGKYKCTGETCKATWTKNGIELEDGGTWTFDPDDGAQVVIPDANYVSFGWWLRKDANGVPTHVDSFAVTTGTPGPIADGANLPKDGSAKYMGKAAGKFAIDNNPEGESNAGHFTADAMLEASFAAGASSLKGELTGFEANEEMVDWKVTLRKAGWNANEFTLNTNGTVWTVGGLSGEQTGMWDAQAFDENAKDNSNVPTTVTGTFETGFGTTHRMVGAFGATK